MLVRNGLGRDGLVRNGLSRDRLVRDGLIRNGLVRDGLSRDGLIRTDLVSWMQEKRSERNRQTFVLERIKPDAQTARNSLKI